MTCPVTLNCPDCPGFEHCSVDIIGIAHGRCSGLADKDIGRQMTRFNKEPKPVLARLAALEEKVDLLLRRLELIFGEHVLVNQRFVDLRVLIDQ